MTATQVTAGEAEYETLYNGAGDRRLRHVLIIVADLVDVQRFCAGTARLLLERGVEVRLLAVSPGEASIEARMRAIVDGLGFADTVLLGHRPLELPAPEELRSTFVRHIRVLRPELVITVDPTPMLRQHPDYRRVARAALDAAWPYAGAATAYPEHGAAHEPKEAWLYAGPAPDIFVTVGEDTGDPGSYEERFAQVDLRDRHHDNDRASEGK